MRSLRKKEYGVHPNGTPIHQFILTNSNGLELKVIELGGIITHLTTPDRDGVFEDIVLGHDSLEDYLNSSYFLGAIAGRYANRIANGRFSLNGIEFYLTKNDGDHNLHSGPSGFHTQIWNGEKIDIEHGVALKFSYISPDGEEGFPGTLKVEVTYILTDSNSLEIEYSATTDKTTIVNLTQHSYFNLSGFKEDILGHQLFINADTFLPTDTKSIPTGVFNPVIGTPFDFTSKKRIGKFIEEYHPQIEIGNGFDHTWVLNKSKEKSLELAASVSHLESGRMMEVYTTEPGVQFYSGNHLANNPHGKIGTANHKRFGLCLETQHYPNSPNTPAFPSTILEPDEVYETKTVFKFLVE